MSTSPETTAFEQSVTPVLRMVLPDTSAEYILSYQPDLTTQKRIDKLAAKSTEDELTPDERAEYAGHVRANKFIAILQAHARKLLAK